MAEKEAFRQHFVIFTYDLSKLNNVTKVRFVYVLKGRKDGKGLVKEYSGRFLVPGCFMIPHEKSNAVEAVFKSWKVPYQKEEVLIR